MADILEEREYVDLDTGVRVVRGAKSRSCMYLIRDEEEGDSVSLEDEEIRRIAELAGYTVTDGEVEHDGFECQDCGFKAGDRDDFDSIGLSMKCPGCGSTSVEHAFK